MKIVRGNDFKLRIEVFEAFRKDGQTGQLAYDLTGADVEVYIVSNEQPRRRYLHTVEYNLVYVFVDGNSLWTGEYDLEVVIRKDGNLRFKNCREFSIVDSTAEGDAMPSLEIETLQLTGVLNIVPVVVPGGGEGTGVVFVPSVNGEGVLSWTNNGGLPNPRPVKIKGEDGKAGLPGESAFTSAQKGGFQGAEDEFYTQLSSIGNINAVLDNINGE